MNGSDIFQVLEKRTKVIMQLSGVLVGGMSLKENELEIYPQLSFLILLMLDDFLIILLRGGRSRKE